MTEPFSATSLLDVLGPACLLALFVVERRLRNLLDPYEWRARRWTASGISLAATLLFLAVRAAPPDETVRLAGAAVSAHTTVWLEAGLLFLSGVAYAELAYLLRPTLGSSAIGALAFFLGISLFAPVPLSVLTLQLAAALSVLTTIVAALSPAHRLVAYAVLPFAVVAAALSPAALILVAVVPLAAFAWGRERQRLLIHAHLWLSGLALPLLAWPLAASALPGWLFRDLSVFAGWPLAWPLLAATALGVWWRRPAPLGRFAFGFALAVTLGLTYGLPGLLELSIPFLILLPLLLVSRMLRPKRA